MSAHDTTGLAGARPGVLPAWVPWGLFAGSALLVHALLLTPVMDALHPALRVAAAFFALVMAPGFAFVRLGLTPPGGALTAPAWAFGFGVAWSAAWVLIARVSGQGIHGLEAVMLAAGAVLWAVALVKRPAVRNTAPIGRAATVAVLLAAAVATLYVGRLGGLVLHQSDGPDHIGTIRRIMVSGDAFPEDAFFRNAGAEGVDPRKGVWHPSMALVGRLAGADALEVWRWLPMWIAPFFVLNIAVLGLLAGGSAGAAVAAWALLLTYGGTLADTSLRLSVYSSRVADQLALAATAAVLADLVRPERRLRVAAALLAFAATTTHLFAAVHLAVPLGALGLAILVRDRGPSAPFRRLFVSSLLVGAASLPYLLWRAQHSYAPVNVIHTETQGMLFLTDGWPVLSIGFLWTTLSNAWVLIPLAWIPLWRWGRRDPMALWMLAATFVTAMMLFNPLLVKVLEPRLGYLMVRFLWFVPLALVLAWIVPRLARAIRDGVQRGRAVVAAAVVAVCMTPSVHDAAVLLADPDATERGEWAHSVMRWQDALEWMRRELPEDAVVISDPVTSYSIPMVAGRYVVTLVDQHSSPNDARAMDRLLDARDALDPFDGWDRLREVVERYDARWIALNDRFAEPPRLKYWEPEPAWFRAARARLDAHPDVFAPVYDSGDFVVYRIEPAALDTLESREGPRPHVQPWAAGEWPDVRMEEPGIPALLGVRLERNTLAPGDTLRGTAVWRAIEPATAGSYTVAVRLDRPLPDGFTPPAFVRKPYRKLVEKLRHERYRVRSNHLPAGGAYGVDRWRADQVVLDPFETVIPHDALPGEWTLALRMVRQPPFPNYRLSDYFFDDDLFAGDPIDTIRIEAGGSADVRH